MTRPVRETLTLGGGCFWCLEAVYEQVNGVDEVLSGYSGGARANPTYEEVCGGRTGHAEVVRLTFDPDVVSARDLLEIFFTIHDPTTLNRQGADVGTQYRSVIYYADAAQKEAAEAVIRELRDAGAWSDPVVTEIAPLVDFYEAEAYHRTYYRRNPNQAYCQFVIAPKLAKLRKAHLDRLRRDPEADAGKVRAYQPDPPNPVDHGGIAE